MTLSFRLTHPVKLFHGEELILEIFPPIDNNESFWFFPVGDTDHSPEVWYAATIHDLRGTLVQPLGQPRRHSGVDLNLDIPPRGDIERHLNKRVYALTDGMVTYVTGNWSGVPMIVVRHKHHGQDLYVRYAHITTEAVVGQSVFGGQDLGGFANFPSDGDHLHLDMALATPFTREWLSPGINWVDPVLILKEHLPVSVVCSMISRYERRS